MYLRINCYPFQIDDGRSPWQMVPYQDFSTSLIYWQSGQSSELIAKLALVRGNPHSKPMYNFQPCQHGHFVHKFIKQVIEGKRLSDIHRMDHLVNLHSEIVLYSRYHVMRHKYLHPLWPFCKVHPHISCHQLWTFHVSYMLAEQSEFISHHLACIYLTKAGRPLFKSCLPNQISIRSCIQ